MPQVGGSPSFRRAPGLFPAAVLTLLLVAACGREKPGQPVDTIPPGPVRDLQTFTVDSTSILLAWTATGDDDSIGTASRYDLRYAPADTIPWDGMTRVPDVPAPRPAGSHESFRVRGLSPATGFAFRLRAADEASNWSPLSAGALGSTLGNDETPPAVVADLTVIQSTATSVRLRWTAPGDDGGLGAAHEYDLRYGRDWDTASRVPLPAPRPAGSVEETAVGGFQPGTTFIAFRLRTRDDNGNWSGLSPYTYARTVTPQDVDWWDGFAPYPEGQGVDGGVRALIVRDDRLIAGGSFSQAGGEAASNIARWDGETWEPMGSGLDNRVLALTLYGGEIIAGGDFTHAGAVPVSHVAAWDGSGWHPLGQGCSAAVGSLVAIGDTLYASTEYEVDRWDGDGWSRLGQPPFDPEFTTGVGAFRGDLIALGVGYASWDSAVYAARWDRTTWRPSLMGWTCNGASGCFCAPLVSLESGGLFVLGGSGTLGSLGPLGRWDGINWSGWPIPVSLQLDICPSIGALMNCRGGLVAAGFFNLDADPPSKDVAFWDGSSWRSFGSGISEPEEPGILDPNGSVRAGVEYRGALYFGGYFHVAGGYRSWNIARWDG